MKSYDNYNMNTKTDYDGVGLDDGLDAEDVAGAMNQRAEEEHISSGKVRAAYYNAYCYLRDLEDAGRDLKNTRLQDDAAQALNHLQHIHDELEAKYQWD
jgi:hypothetical protein